MKKSASNIIKTTKALLLILISVLFFNSFIRNVNQPAQAQSNDIQYSVPYSPSCQSIGNPVCTRIRYSDTVGINCSGVPEECASGEYDVTKDENYIAHIESRDDFEKWQYHVSVSSDNWSWTDKNGVNHYDCNYDGTRSLSNFKKVPSPVCEWQRLVVRVGQNQYTNYPISIGVGNNVIGKLSYDPRLTGLEGATIKIYENNGSEQWTGTTNNKGMATFDTIKNEGSYTVMATKGGKYIAGYSAFELHSAEIPSHLSYEIRQSELGVKALSGSGRNITSDCSWDIREKGGSGMRGSQPCSNFEKGMYACWPHQKWEARVTATCMGKTLDIIVPAKEDGDDKEDGSSEDTCHRFSEGDANCDGEIKKDDFVLWLNSYRAGNNDADFNGKNGTDKADFVIWLNSYREENL